MSKVDILKAYRALYRTGLQAVMYAKPARFALRNTLREAFRDPDGRFDAEAARRTVLFLRSAARERGLAHRVVKNLMHVAWHRQNLQAVPYSTYLLHAEQKPQDCIQRTAFAHYSRTIEMLNRTMGLCLR